MILEKMRSVNSILLDSVNATGNKHAVETFRNQLGLLNTSTTQLEQLLNLMEAMQDKAITPKIMTAEIKTSLQNAVDSCGEKVYDHSLDASTVQALKSVVDLYRNAIFSVWKQSADKQCSPVIESLVSLRGILVNKSEADELIGALQNAKVSPPSSINAINKYLSNLEKGKKLIEDMHFDSDSEVKAFIRKVQSQRATVDDLSPHILEWLKDNHLTNKIKLRF